MKIVIVKKTGVLGELDWKKNVDLVSIYKKCGFKMMRTAMANLNQFMSDPNNAYLE